MNNDLQQSFAALGRAFMPLGSMLAAALDGFVAVADAVIDAVCRAFATPSPPRRPARHAFTPDYDLWCTQAGCTLTAEEH